MSQGSWRPKPTDPGIAERIAERLIAGESVRKICRDEDMPSESGFYVALQKDEAFRSVIAPARVAQQDAMAEGTVDLADTATPETVQVVKLQIWARQWLAGKLAPKKYGDKLDLNHGGDLTVRHEPDYSGLTQVERDQMRALLQKAEKPDVPRLTTGAFTED